MKYIDLHCHPTLKAMFKNEFKPGNNWNGIFPANKIFGDIIESQTCYNQLIQSSNLVVIALHPIESGMIDNWLIKLASRTILKNYLHTKKLDSIRSGDINSNKLLREEYSCIEDKDPKGVNQIKVLKSMSEYNPSDLNTLHVIISVEGGHAYYGGKNELTDYATISKNFKDFLSNESLFLYQTITHLTDNVLANHCYGNKILPKEKMLPSGDGITSDGKKFIELVYDSNVLVDLKHLSLVSRKQLYKLRKEKNITKPLIFSHGATTGFSWTNILGKNDQGKFKVRKIIINEAANKVRLDYYPYYNELTYLNHYPLSINIYDEEIVEIIKSKGLIGLTLDTRILGAKGGVPSEFLSFKEFKKWEVDFFKNKSKSEEMAMFKGTSEEMFNDVEVDYFVVDNGDLFEEEVIDEKLLRASMIYQSRIFANQILHIHSVIKVAQQTHQECLGIDPLNHICIGSDFDGLIQTPSNCRNAKFIDNFIGSVKTVLPIIAKDAGVEISDLDGLLVRIFHDNLFNFIKEHFKK